jgi:hypothetical protein
LDRHTHARPPTMQSLPESRQQSFEELYGPPENFLEIEVCTPPRGKVKLTRVAHRSATP